MSTTRVVTQTRRCLCGCGEDIEYVELRTIDGTTLLDAWWQHVNPESLDTPEL